MDSRDKGKSLEKNADINYQANCSKNNNETSKQNVCESESLYANGPIARNVNTLPNNDSRPDTASNRTNTGCVKNITNSNQSQMCNKIKSNHLDQLQAGGSIAENTNSDNVEASDLSCQRHRVCLDKAGINYNAPSTSGSNKSCDKNVNSTLKESRKRPSSLRLNRQNDEDGSSSDTGNDDCSLGSEEGCVYTYRGGEHLADLPSSFFSLDMGLPLDKHLPAHPNYVQRPEPAQNVRERSRESSPDMDFLEMDFDPGPSNEADSGDELSPDELVVDLVVEDDIIVNDIESEMAQAPSPECVNHISTPFSCDGLSFMPIKSNSDNSYYNIPSTSSGITRPSSNDIKAETSVLKPSISASRSETCGALITHVNVRGEHLLVRRTTSQMVTSLLASLHVSSGDLVSPRELLNKEDEPPEDHLAYQINQGERPTKDPINRHSAIYHLNMAKRLMAEETAAENSENQPDIAVESGGDGDGAGVVEVPRCMVWTEREACERQVTQIGTSACGATAVVNVFIALGAPVNIERINAAVGTRQRANTAPLPRYLLSRAVAGCTGADLVNAIQRASDGLITARFFPTYPERVMSLSHWLADWISLGAIPILTLNLQVTTESEIPDAWHHQMVFGVSSRGIYLCNPVECVRETALWPRLTSPSVLLVRTRDVLSRFTPRTDLTPLMVVPDRRFHTANVLGQVVNVLREWRATGWSEHGLRTRHITVPASYQAGVTVAALTGSEAHRRLMHASQLPKLHDDDADDK